MKLVKVLCCMFLFASMSDRAQNTVGRLSNDDGDAEEDA